LLHETRTLLLLVASLILALGCNSMNQTTPKVQQSSFGATSDGTAVDLFTLSNRNGMTVKLISYGATIIDVHAPDRNGTFAEPLPAGAYTSTGRNPFNVDSDGHRNGATGPGLFQLDVRVGYRLRPAADRSLDLFADIFNVTNRANFDNPTGDRRSTDFLNLTVLRAGAIPTTAQLGVRFEF